MDAASKAAAPSPLSTFSCWVKSFIWNNWSPAFPLYQFSWACWEITHLPFLSTWVLRSVYLISFIILTPFIIVQMLLGNKVIERKVINKVHGFSPIEGLPSLDTFLIMPFIWYIPHPISNIIFFFFFGLSEIIS